MKCPCINVLEETLNEYIVAAGLQSGQPPCFRALIHLEWQ
jgi:hypothetical protein